MNEKLLRKYIREEIIRVLELSSSGAAGATQGKRSGSTSSNIPSGGGQVSAATASGMTALRNRDNDSDASSADGGDAEDDGTQRQNI